MKSHAVMRNPSGCALLISDALVEFIDYLISIGDVGSGRDVNNIEHNQCKFPQQVEGFAHNDNNLCQRRTVFTHNSNISAPSVTDVNTYSLSTSLISFHKVGTEAY